MRERNAPALAIFAVVSVWTTGLVAMAAILTLIASLLTGCFSPFWIWGPSGRAVLAICALYWTGLTADAAVHWWRTLQ